MSRLFLCLCLVFSASVLHAQNGRTTQTDTLPINELKTFNDVFLLIKQNYVDEVSDAELINNAIRGMLSGLDPHSTFLSLKDFSNFENSTTGRFGGVGLEVTMENGFIKVISPIANSPAAEAGIQSGDVIIRIDNESIQGLDLEQAVQRMRGEPNTVVNFTVLRDGEDVPIDFQLTRQFVKTQSIVSRLFDNHYGYIYISQFQLPTGNDLRLAINELKQRGDLYGLVLDLRNNPGGVLSGAINVSDAFLEDGVIVSTKGRNDASQSLVRATPGDIMAGKPIVVLINSGSASASEIVAGALQDNQRAVIMGTTSFGKGSVQNILQLSNQDAVKLTTARYFTPNDRSIQATGIEPDIVVTPLKLEASSTPDFTFTESTLQGHLESGANDSPSEIDELSTDNSLNNSADNQDANADAPATPQNSTPSASLATQDYVLYEALSLLKALQVIQQN